MGITLETLLERATGGVRPDRRRHFRPSLLYTLLDCPFNIWCDHHAPASAKVDETGAYDKLRMQWGSEYEHMWVRQHYPEAFEVPQTHDLPALKATFEAMLRGERAIHGAQLWLLPDEMYGMADLLLRDDDHASDLGPYSYRVVEVKRSKKVDSSPDADDYRVLQGFAYHRILARLQSFAPASFTIALRDSQVEVPTERLDARLNHHLNLWRSIRDGAFRPRLPDYDKGTSPWRLYANSLLEELRDVTLAPGITGSARNKLASRLNVKTAEDVERLSLADLQRGLGKMVGLQAFYRLEAKRQKRPILAPGARVDLPRRKRHIYFDFETSDETHPEITPHVYMIGFFDLEKQEYRVLTARGPGEERAIFSAFLDHVGGSDACLYHWASFEVDTMTKEVMPRHPDLAPDLQRIVGLCVDLKEAIKNKVFFPTRTYSIKEVAPSIGFKWKQDSFGAYESMVAYWEYVRDADEDKMRRIVQYNRDDCEAMLAVDRCLQHLGLVPHGCS